MEPEAEQQIIALLQRISQQLDDLTIATQAAGFRAAGISPLRDVCIPFVIHD